MNFDPKTVRRALMIAKDLAVKIDPGFAVHNLPMPPQGVPLERAAGGKTDLDLQTAQRLGFDTSSIPEIKRAGELSKFHQSMMGSVSETARKMQDLGNEYHQSGLLPHPIGTLLHTPFSKKNGQPPLRVTGHYVDPKNPSRYGYMFEQGESSGTAMVSDPKADERIRKTNPDWDREDYWSQAQPLTGPQGFAKAKGGPIKTVQGPEREQNLAEFMRGAHPLVLDKNGKPKVFYHGRTEDFSTFSNENAPYRGGLLAFFSESPKFAGAYATSEDGNVSPVHLNIKNPFDFRDKFSHVDARNFYRDNGGVNEWDADKIRDGLGLGPGKLTEDQFVRAVQKGHWPALEAHEFVEWLQGLRHDGIVTKEGNAINYGVFDPTQIKSAVGNVGTFDPADPDITKAEGGEVDAPQGYTPQPPGTLETDNPGGEWLEQQKQYSASRGYRPSGAPMSFGKVTAVWSDRKKNEMAPVYLPVSMLKQIPGVMNEQQNVREHSLSGLVEHMGKIGRLPKFSEESTREYHPFITVDQRGMPFVNEGNHRIMAADRLGWKWLPVEVRYFNGGEDVDGPLHPDRIRAMHGVEPAKKAEGGEVEAAGMGINVRSDKKAGIRYADEIVDGNKKYETRDSDSLRPYVGKRVAIVRTGEGPARAIGEVTVGEPIVADHETFHKLRPHHLVPAGSTFDIKPGGQKYLYPMHDPVRFDADKDVGAGIVSRKVITKAYGGDVDVKAPIIDPAKAIRRAMMIAKAGGGELTEKPAKVRKTAMDFLPESLPDVSINSLTKAFTEGINEHLALPDKERIQNSRAAKKVIAARNGSGALLAKNGKLLKTETGAGDDDPVELPDGRGIETTGLSLAPAFQVGKFNTCPNHASCKASCLGVTSGGNFMFGGGRDLEEMKGPRLAHLKNTLAMILHPKEFAVRLNDEIASAKQQAAANGNKLGVRLNVLSDIHPRAYEALIKAHPDVDFYDYTKLDSNPIAPNHHLTYSSTGTAQPAGVNGNDTDVDNAHQNWRRMRRRLDMGSNVAMAFSHGSVLPEFVHDLESDKKYRVVNGDDHDFRPMDRQAEGADGVIVGLKNKKAFGKEQEAHIDSNGFFTYYDPKIVKDPMGGNVVTNNTVQVAPQPGAKRMMTNDSTPEEKQNG